MKPKILLLFLLLAGTCLYAIEPEGNLYLTPQRVFHISRSINHNLVCYDVNLVDGSLLGEPGRTDGREERIEFFPA